MSINEINVVKWDDDGVSVTFEDFYSYAISEGFKFIFTFPMGEKPSVAFAARTLEDLNKHIEPIQGIAGFNL